MDNKLDQFLRTATKNQLIKLLEKIKEVNDDDIMGLLHEIEQKIKD